MLSSKTLQTAMQIVWLLLGGIIAVNAVIAALLSNFTLGIALSGVLGIALLTVGTFWKPLFKRLPRLTLALPAVTVAVLLLFTGVVFLYGHVDTVTYAEDAVIVLGTGIRGEEPSATLAERLDRAVAYHQKNPDALLVVSGGQGPQETVTEAYAMERYLLAHGVDPACILKEDRSTSTDENFRFSKALLDAHFQGDYRVAFISSDSHIYRAERLAALAGFEDITHAHSATPWYMCLPNGLREDLVIVKLWLVGR